MKDESIPRNVDAGRPKVEGYGRKPCASEADLRKLVFAIISFLSFATLSFATYLSEKPPQLCRTLRRKSLEFGSYSTKRNTIPPSPPWGRGGTARWG